MPISYQNIQELNNSVGVSISNKVDPGWKINSDSAKAVAQFYEQWAVYLSPQKLIFHEIVSFLLGSLAKILYFFSYSIEEIYNSLFKLFGFLSFIDNQNTFIGSMFFWFQVLGTVVFLFLLVVRVVTSFIGTRVRFQYVINHFLLVTAVTAFLPFATQAAIQVLVPTVQNVSQNNQGNSLSLQPIADNTVDLVVLIENSWDVDKLGYEENSGYLNITKAKLNDNRTNYNYFTDKTFSSVNFGEFYGAREKDVLQEFIEMSEGDKQSPYYGMADILSSKLAINFKTKNGQITKIDKGSHFLGEFSSVYPRYSVNWIPMYLQQIVVGIVLVMISIVFTTSVFNIVVQTIIAPIVGYSSVEDSTKFKDLLSTLIGGYAGLVFQIILLRIAMEIMRSYKSIGLSGVPGLSNDSLSSGLSYWQNIVLSFIIYISMYFVVMNGSRAIDRWLGIQSRNLPGLAAGYSASRSLLRSRGNKNSSGDSDSRGNTFARTSGYIINNLTEAMKNFGQKRKKSPLPSSEGPQSGSEKGSPLPSDPSGSTSPFDDLFTPDGSPLPKGDNSPTPPGDESPLPKGDNSPTPPGDESPLPKGDNSPTPSGDKSPLPKGDNSPTPSGDKSPLPKGDNSPTPPGDESPLPKGDNSPTPPGDESPLPKGDNSPTPSGDKSPLPKGDNSPTPPGDESPLPKGDNSPTPSGDKSPTPQVKNPKKEERLNNLSLSEEKGLEKKRELSLDDF
ncbi:pLS20_p028 family conjugation system transmembrane protein [Streptococcus suis]